MSSLIHITVQPHVAIYLRHHFGSKMSMSEKNFVSMILLKLFAPFDKVDPFLLKQQRKESLGDTFTVYMSSHFLKKIGAYLSNENIQLFNESVDLLIKQDMYRWCQHPNADHKEVDYNIKRFINFYDFNEDDLSFDNLKRWYYRERERISKRKTTEIPADALEIPMLLTYQNGINTLKQMELFE